MYHVSFIDMYVQCSTLSCSHKHRSVSVVSTKTATQVTSFTCGTPPLLFLCPRKRSWRTCSRGRTVVSRPSDPSHKNDCRTTAYSFWNWIDDNITDCDRNDRMNIRMIVMSGKISCTVLCFSSTYKTGI